MLSNGSKRHNMQLFEDEKDADGYEEVKKGDS
jgi:hypothetical protein